MNQKRVIALGFFDGVHLGHGVLLRKARQRADALGCRAAALTFDVHPAKVLTGKKVPLLTSTRDRARLMKDLYGMDEVIVLPFDEETAGMDWESFVEQYLAVKYAACYVVCGYDYSFGHMGRGTPERLREKCRTLGIGCDIVGKEALDGETLSSTGIRQLLEQGSVEEANRRLGHPYEITGTVVGGKQLGRKLGIPTANVPVPEGILLPAYGVYAAKVHLPDGTIKAAVTNVGIRPTVNDGLGPMIEPWILNYDGNLYGQEIRIAFYSRLRPERSFESLDALKAEILRNAEQVRSLFPEFE